MAKTKVVRGKSPSSAPPPPPKKPSYTQYLRNGKIVKRKERSPFERTPTYLTPEYLERLKKEESYLLCPFRPVRVQQKLQLRWERFQKKLSLYLKTGVGLEQYEQYCCEFVKEEEEGEGEDAGSEERDGREIEEGSEQEDESEEDVIREEDREEEEEEEEGRNEDGDQEEDENLDEETKKEACFFF